MEHPDINDMPNERDTARGYANDTLGRTSMRLLKAMSLFVVLALILSSSSVITFNTDNGLVAVLLVVVIAAVLLVSWGFHSRTTKPGADR